MQATVELPDAVAGQLEALAAQEGTTVEKLIERLVSGYVRQLPALRSGQGEVSLPLVAENETGPVRTVTGADLDEIFAREDFAA